MPSSPSAPRICNTSLTWVCLFGYLPTYLPSSRLLSPQLCTSHRKPTLTWHSKICTTSLTTWKTWTLRLLTSCFWISTKRLRKVFPKYFQHIFVKVQGRFTAGRTIRTLYCFDHMDWEMSCAASDDDIDVY